MTERLHFHFSLSLFILDSQWEFAVKFRGFKLGLGNNIEGAMGRQVEGMLKRVGTLVNLWLSHADVY